MPRPLILPAFCLLALAARAPAAATPTTTTASAATATTPANRWLTIIKDLADPDPARRRAAQDEIDHANSTDFENLNALATTIFDPLIQNPLSARLDARAKNLILHPPPISLDLKDATLDQVADALAKALQIYYVGHVSNYPPVYSPETSNAAKFTLTAKDQPYWEVFFALARQHPLDIDPASLSTTLRLVGPARNNQATGAFGWQKGVISGPLAIVPTVIERDRNASLQLNPANQLGTETLRLNYVCALDPRNRYYARWADLRFDRIIDDLGNDLTPLPTPPVLHDSRSLIHYGTAILPFPARLGTRIVSATGTCRVVIPLANIYLQIPDAHSQIGKPITFAGHTVNLVSFAIHDGSSVDFRVDASPPATAPGSPPVPFLFPFNLDIYDSTNKPIINCPLPMKPNGFNTIKNLNEATPPFSIRLRTVNTMEYAVPFEFKDLPLP